MVDGCRFCFLYIQYIFLLSCIYSYRLWNILTVLLTLILSHIHISLMFCHYISCKYTYKLPLYSKQYIILNSYFPNSLLLHITYIHLNTLQCIVCILNCTIFPNSFPFSNETFSIYLKFPNLFQLHNTNYRLLCRMSEYNWKLHN